ncbi:MAG: hypothetical protein Q4D45_12900 [Lachnospiraceae bacterium]|nr:hypothetical protein [Lachnospiraceae bacterium]
MKKQLRIEYKDGGKVKITNSRCTSMSFFIMYLMPINPNSILNAGIYTYPLKNNEPFILIKDGERIEKNISMLFGH